MATPAPLDHARHIATPSRLAMAIGKRVTGFDFVLWNWLAYVERRVIDAILDKRSRFLIVNLPPQVGKTTFSGVFLPAWFQGMFPGKRTMFVSYADDYSVKYGRAVRTILDRFGEQYFGVGIDRSAQSASDWQMQNSMGGMLSTGIGGVLTGYGGDLIVIDDVIKNIQEARSQATKRMHIDWYDSTLRSRLHAGGTILITATRWAEDDLSGTLIERMAQPGYSGDPWEVIALPALAEPSDEEERELEELDGWRDMLGRSVGESICEELHPAEEYQRIRESGMDRFLWSCVWQQRPMMPEGGMFPYSKWQLWNPQNKPEMRRQARCWDLATTEGGGDWTVGVLMAQARNDDLYVLDRQRFQKSTSDVEAAVKFWAAQDGYQTTIIIEQEKAGAGKALFEHYQRILPGYTVVPGKSSDGSKEERAAPYSAMQQVGRVWLPEHAPWLEEWKKEHQAMMGDGRRPRHDDQIDTAAYCALNLLGTQASEIWIPGQDVLAGGMNWADILSDSNPWFATAR